MLNWCEGYIIEICFLDLFFSNESTFYLDSSVGARLVKSEENYIHPKNKGRKIVHGLKLVEEERHHCISMNKI